MGDLKEEREKARKGGYEDKLDQAIEKDGGTRLKEENQRQKAEEEEKNKKWRVDKSQDTYHNP